MSEATFEKGVSNPKEELNGKGLRIANVRTRWNYTLVDKLHNVVYDTLKNKYSVSEDDIFQDTVSGASELPMAAKQLIDLSSKEAAQEGATNLLDSSTLTK